MNLPKSEALKSATLVLYQASLANLAQKTLQVQTLLFFAAATVTKKTVL